MFMLSQRLFSFLHHWQGNSWGYKTWEDTAGTATSADQKGIPDHTVSCSVYKLEWKMASGCMHLAGHWSAVVSNCIVHHLFCTLLLLLLSLLLLLLLFSLPVLSYETFFSSTHKLYFFPPHSLPHPTGWWEDQTRSCVVFSYLPG